MLALRPEQRPHVDVAFGLLASVFGPAGVRTGGTIFTQFEARGSYRGLPVRVVFAMCNTRRSTEPFTTIEVETDLDVSVYSGGADWPYESWEPFAPFPSSRLGKKAAVGAPRALVSRIALGPIGDRLAATTVTHFTLGTDAQREGCATRGVHVDFEGWPHDEASLRFILDTVVEMALAARHEVAAPVAGATAFQAEMAAYRSARAASRAKGLKVVAAVFAGLAAVSALVVAAVIGVM